MAYLIGTDEAGYGPNLGPLVIAATLWQTPDAFLDRDLYALCSDSICSTHAASSGTDKLFIADSKVLYKKRGKLQKLESGVFATAADLGHRPSHWLDIWRLLAPDALEQLNSVPWYADVAMPLPWDADLARIERLAAVFRAGQKKSGVRLRKVRSVALFPAQFNRRVAQRDSKGTVLSEQTISLVKRLLEDLDEEPVLVQCDKHGGRNRYGALLQDAFPDQLVRVLQESRGCSRYQWGSRSQPVEIRFTAKGESFLPAALASMVAKYLRELAMMALNAYWRLQVPGIRATAGYPVDAQRFKSEIALRQGQLGLPDEILWRKR